MSKTNELIQRFLGEPAKNLMHAMYDDYVEANVSFRSRSGMKTFIIRRQLGKCCEWCAGLAGIYESDKAPNGVYQRHDNCKCMVTFRNEAGKYQDVWTKQEYNSQREARLARASEIKNANQLKERSDKLIREYISKSTPGAGRYVVEPGVKLKKEANAVDHAGLIHKIFGGDIRVLKTIDDNGIKNPDYLWRGKYWEHKTFTSRNSVYHQVKKGIEQIKENPGGLILQRVDNKVPIEVIEDEIIRTFKTYGPKFGVKTMDVIIFDQKKVVRIIRMK